MPLDAQLRELLERWDDLRGLGPTPAPEDLCHDCPGRLDELRILVHDLLALDPPDDATAEPPPAANGDRPLTNEVASELRYRPRRFHARGGQGDVYLAHDETLNRDVALKRLQPRRASRSDAVRRFLREAEVCARLQHPGVVPVYTQGHDADGLPYYTMRFVEGESLKAAIERLHGEPVALAPGTLRGPTPPARPFDSLEFRRLLQRFVSVCETVAYTHSKGVIHRDLKPANIMLGPFGETLVVDWGLAKLADSDAASRSLDDTPTSDRDTHAGEVIGTPAYMAPEQARGETGRVGPAADVYSLGATLCELLGNATSSPPALLAVCRKAMAPEPTDRYASAADLAGDIEHWLADEPVGAWREQFWPRMRRWMRRHTRLTTGVAAALAVAVVAAGVATVLLTASNQRERRAKESAQAREAETKAILDFVESKIVAAARPEGQSGGLGYKVTLRQALETALPAVAAEFRDRPLVEAHLRGTLGTSFWRLGDAKTAAEQFMVARTLYEQAHGPDHPDTLHSMHGLAIAYYDLGRYADALQLCSETLALRKVKLGPDHPDTLQSMHSLATDYAALGRYAEAFELRKTVLAQRREVLGRDDPDTLLSMNDLASSCTDLGRFSDAAKLLEEAVPLSMARLGTDHPETLRGMTNLALNYAALGRHADALRLRETTLALRKAKLGPDHAETLQSMDYLAASLATVGRLTDAIGLREETVARQKASLGADHPYTLIGMNNLANLYAKVGRHADALRVRQETLPLQRSKFGPDHPQTLICMANLADSLMAAGRGREALTALDECIDRAGRRSVDPRLMPFVMELRLRCFEREKDVAGCRATAEMWERLNRTDAGSYYTAACYRAVTAAIVGPSPDGDAEADRAMAWLHKAVSAGFRDVTRLLTDADLAPLRGRADYAALLWQLADAPPK
jgi:tetratricopeptide (TPR) repeat protein/tRNA A-37 threonylcarbamoyl transferase component Bud32